MKVLKESNPPNKSEAFWRELDMGAGVCTAVQLEEETDPELQAISNVILLATHMTHIAEGGQP